MTIVVSQKQRIHFRFEGERGAFIILHHGLFGSHQDWFEAGYVDELATEFRVIVPDARGHGRSDRPVDPEAYTLAGLSEDLVAIMDWMEVRNAHFVGYSLGALVGFDLLHRYPERVRLVMLGGEVPFVIEPARNVWKQVLERLRHEPLSRWVQQHLDEETLVRTAPVNDEEEQAPAVALMEAMTGWPVPQEEKLPVRSPITLFAAGEDPAAGRVELAARRIPRARFYHFSDFTHRGLFRERQTVLDGFLRFVRSGRRPEPSGRDRRDGPGAARNAGNRSGEPEAGPPAGGEPAGPGNDDAPSAGPDQAAGSGRKRGGPSGPADANRDDEGDTTP